MINSVFDHIKGGRYYFGEFKNGMEHGIGYYSIELWNQKFVGEFKNDKANGIGLKIQGPETDWERKIVCEFLDNSHEGIGMYVWPSGAKYVGHFKDDVAKGLGIFITHEGFKYIGNMSNDDNEIGVKGIGCKGHDFFIRGDGIWYDAQNNIVDIKKFGYDVHGFKRINNVEYWPDGTYYVGDFKNDLYHGYGKLYFSESRFYEGQFSQGMFHGKGIFHHGDEYVVGQFLNHHISGYAEAKFNRGSYKGYWNKNRFHGEGILIYDDLTFDGTFFNVNINDTGGRSTNFISKNNKD